MMGFALLLAYAACIPLANFLIGNVGTVCVPNGPCLIPVWPGVMAPSGVLMIGLALVLRDMAQRQIGAGWSLAAICVGVVLSAAFAPGPLVLASAAAFALSELADFAVYTPLQKRGLILAVVASSCVGLAIDSAVFLWLAFGSLDFIAGQIIGKAWMVLAAVPVLYAVRRAA